MVPLGTAILRTLAYFDIFDYPLTADQVWRWIFPKLEERADATFDNVHAALASMARGEGEGAARERKVVMVGEYYCLPGRESTVQIRSDRWKFGQKKWKRVLSAVRFFELVPFVRMVAVVNTLAIDNARQESDMDLLIITKPGRIWMTRLMVTGIVSLLGYRRHGEKITNRICLSFYATTNSMNFANLRIMPEDPHFMFWTSQVVPLLNDRGTYEKFQTENAWVKESLPNAWDWAWQKRVLKPNKNWQRIKVFFETAFSQPIGDVLEGMVRDRQLAKMAKNTESKAKEGTTEVVINDEILKFHEDDRRARYNEKFVLKLQELGQKKAPEVDQGMKND